MKRIRSFAFVPLMLLGACVTTPPTNDALEEARAAYRAAQAAPHVPSLAPEALDAAGRTLNRAEALWRDGEEPIIVGHYAYLAEQRSRIARETAMMRAAEAELARASETRERAVLEAKAEQARSEADREQTQAKQLRAEVERLEAAVAELEARPSARGWVLAVGSDVLFDVGQASLKPGARRALGQLAAFLRQHPEREIAIEGFTDSTGSEELNRRLSERRALAVRDVLVRMGVERERLTARGMGAAFPVASNDTAAGRQLNRRVEVVVPGGAAATGASR